MHCLSTPPHSCGSGSHLTVWGVCGCRVGIEKKQDDRWTRVVHVIHSLPVKECRYATDVGTPWCLPPSPQLKQLGTSRAERCWWWLLFTPDTIHVARIQVVSTCIHLYPDTSCSSAGCILVDGSNLKCFGMFQCFISVSFHMCERLKPNCFVSVLFQVYQLCGQLKTKITPSLTTAMVLHIRYAVSRIRSYSVGYCCMDSWQHLFHYLPNWTNFTTLRMYTACRCFVTEVEGLEGCYTSTNSLHGNRASDLSMPNDRLMLGENITLQTDFDANFSGPCPVYEYSDLS